MKFQSARIITNDIKRLVAFYEFAIGTKANWFTEDYAELKSELATLAIASTKTLGLFGGDSFAQSGTNRSVILEFKVNNVDTEFERIGPELKDVVQKPTTMPWGNRSLLMRDPDGNLVNFFTPVSPEALKRVDHVNKQN